IAEMRLRFGFVDAFDAVFVGYPGHFDVPRARRVAGRRPLVFNPLISLHDTLVGDRSRFRQGLFAARILWMVDRRALRLSDFVVACACASSAPRTGSFTRAGGPTSRSASSSSVS